MLSKLRSLFANQKTAANAGYILAAVGAFITLTIFSVVGLLIVVTILGVDVFSNITGVSEIQTNFIAFISNIFALLPVIGTLLAVSALIAVVVVVIYFVWKMNKTGTGGEQIAG